MNTVSTHVEHHQQHASPSFSVNSESSGRPARRVGTLDRLALHVGVALVKWGRRPLNSETRERRASRTEQLLARAARERSAEREYRLMAPQR